MHIIYSLGQKRLIHMAFLITEYCLLRSNGEGFFECQRAKVKITSRVVEAYYVNSLLRSHGNIGLLGQIALPMKCFCVDDLKYI